MFFFLSISLYPQFTSTIHFHLLFNIPANKEKLKQTLFLLLLRISYTFGYNFNENVFQHKPKRE